MQWVQNLFDMTVASYADFIYCASDISETQPRLTIAVAAENDETVLARFVGCVLIGGMPDRVLPEVLHSLRDIWEFYNEEPLQLRVPRRLPQRIEATVAGHKKRPDMVISH